MKIAHYIADLLFEHECVVIPGLGGFISKDHPASIHPLKHQFRPPYREIVFNPHLRTNDGLLLSLIAQSENLSYQDAKGNLDRFVLKCIDGLNKGHRIHFRNIGSIAFNQDKQIVFIPDENQNYMSTSFGLTSFVSPAIIREGFSERIENQVFGKSKKSKEVTQVIQPIIKPEKRKVPKPSDADYGRQMLASKKPSNVKRQWYMVGAFVLIMGFAWSYMNKQIVQQYYNAYAGLVPFFYSSPNDYLLVNSEKFPLDKILPSVKAINGLDKRTSKNGLVAIENNLEPAVQPVEQPIENPIITDTASSIPDTYLPDNQINTYESPASVDQQVNPQANISQTENSLPEVSQAEIRTVEKTTEPIVKPEPEPEIVISEHIGPQYLIIAGAFREKTNAEKLILELSARGHNAVMSGQNKRGLWLVSIGRYDQLTDAKKQLETVRCEEGKDLWILKM
jgi:cell division septation protein DedD